MKRLLLRLVVVAAMGAMVLALATPAFAFHEESHIGGGTPGDVACNPGGSCNFGGGGRSACDQETGECLTSGGSGFHQSFDPTTGDDTFAGGAGGSNGGPEGDPGGAGVHCEGNAYTGEYDCHGSPGTSA